MLSYAVYRASHPPFISNKNRSLPQKEGKCAQVFSSILYCFLNLSLQYPWPTGPQDWKLLRTMKSLENYLLLVTKGEHPDYFTPSLDFVLSFFNPKSNPPSLHFRAGVSKGGLRLKSELCVGCPGHLVGNERASPLKWKRGHMEGEQACNLHSLPQTTAADPAGARPLGLCLLPYPRGRLHSPGQMNGMCGITSTRHAGAPHGGKLATASSCS